MRGTDTLGGAWSKAQTVTVSGYFTGGSVRYKENEDFVIVNIQDVSLNTQVGGSSVTFASGLPAIPANAVFIITDWQGKRFLRILYSTTGDLKIHYPETTAASDIQFCGQTIVFKR